MPSRPTWRGAPVRSGRQRPTPGAAVSGSSGAAIVPRLRSCENRARPLGSLPFGMHEHDRASFRLLPLGQPGVGAQRHQVEPAHRLHQRIARDEAGEAEEQRRRLAVGDEKPLGVEDLRLRIDALGQKEVRGVRELAPVGVMVGVIDPQDVERAGIALIDEPAEIGEVMDEPEAGNRQGDGSAWARRLEPGEERPIERPFARAEIAGEKIARRRAMGQPGVLKKAAMDETRRLGRFADRAAHAGRLELGLAHLAAGPAGRALEPGRQRLRIGKQGELLAGDGHLADRHRLAAVGGDACLQHRPIVGDRGRALKPRRRRRREGAVGARAAPARAAQAASVIQEKAQEGGQGRNVRSGGRGPLLTKPTGRARASPRIS